MGDVRKHNTLFFEHNLTEPILYQRRYSKNSNREKSTWPQLHVELTRHASNAVQLNGFFGKTFYFYNLFSQLLEVVVCREVKGLQSKEEWRFPFWNISFRFEDIHLFVLCKWRHT